jgi:hypothetical protein
MFLPADGLKLCLSIEHRLRIVGNGFQFGHECSVRHGAVPRVAELSAPCAEAALTSRALCIRRAAVGTIERAQRRLAVQPCKPVVARATDVVQTLLAVPVP